MRPRATPLGAALLAAGLAAGLAACGGGGGESGQGPRSAEATEVVLKQGPPDTQAPPSGDDATEEPNASKSRGPKNPFLGQKLDVPLNLTLTVTDDGIEVRTSSGHVATGCARLGSGVTLPFKQGGAGDLSELTTCVSNLKHARPEFESESDVTVEAARETTYAMVIKIMDAIRADGDGPLFTDVRFGVRQ